MVARTVKAIVILAGIASGILGGGLIDATRGHASTTAALSLEPIVDPGDPVVSSASFTHVLVQGGTTQPYRGFGPPGIRLTVQAQGDVIGWTLEGWANETAPTSPRICSSSSVYFDRHDWIYEGGSPGGAYNALPSTELARAGPSGDNCNARIYAFGTWETTVCIEGDPVGDGDVAGPPRGIYRAADGRLHVDLWDRCIEKPFQVPG